MRFKLRLEVNKRAFGNVLPINYQYEQSAVIYRILSRASEEYATWLHENGFRLENGKRFKLFAYSWLKIEKRQILKEEERIRIFSDSVEWQISFLPERSTEKFIQGLFSNQVFEIGDKKSVVQFRVQHVEVLPPPDFSEEMEFSTMSPICIKQTRSDGGVDYLSPADKNAKAAMLTGLLSRYQAFYGKPYEGELFFDFKLLNDPKSVLVKIKADGDGQTKVRAYRCRFSVKAPKALMQILYESGLGEECAQGFGCVRVIKPSTIDD
ncbi:CRISPR-associated endoribonuclease Cas6 [Bacteroides heparinolyticus]|uniref:CRISPR-associated endoribonuclease Cas6 n=1 Tax=Prevotella heparinolytica TaxID=28113 RepID=UPI00359FF8A5